MNMQGRYLGYSKNNTSLRPRILGKGNERNGFLITVRTIRIRIGLYITF